MTTQNFALTTITKIIAKYGYALDSMLAPEFIQHLQPAIDSGEIISEQFEFGSMNEKIYFTKSAYENYKNLAN